MDNCDDRNVCSHVLQATRSPTRRRLLTLMPGLLIATSRGSPSRTTFATDINQPSSSDLIPNLFAEFEGLLAKHEAALTRCDRREAWLLAELDYPRVKLPLRPDGPVQYAADLETIALHVPPGRQRYRLQQILIRRRDAWNRGVQASGLARAREREAAFDTAVRATAARLIATPARTILDLRLKLLTLLATQEPGDGFCDSSPWRELHLLLSDLDRLRLER